MRRRHTVSESVAKPSAVDPTEWDCFVKGVGGDTLAQSSLWADVKGPQYEPIRLVVRDTREPSDATAPTGPTVPSGSAAPIVAGIQVLVRSTPFGSLAYAPKGPLLCDGLASTLRPGVATALLRQVEDLGASLVILQPATADEALVAALQSSGYSKAPLDIATNATIDLALHPSEDELLLAMNKSRRQCVRKALRGELTVRMASRADIPAFAELHAATAERQGFDPIPCEAIFHQWDTLHDHHRLDDQEQHFQIFLAELDGKVVAGCSLTIWGGRVVGKLLGWKPDPVVDKLRPNDLLQWESIRWAKATGNTIYDMGGFDRDAALRFVNEEPYGETFRSSASQYKLAFGGTPVVLPEAQWRVGPGALRWLQQPASRLIADNEKIPPLLNKLRVR